jgi:hypothetical protein
MDEKPVYRPQPKHFLAEHPRLTADSVRAAIAFAAAALRSDIVYPVETG